MQQRFTLKFSICLLFLCATLVIPTSVNAEGHRNWGYGPIELRNQYPLHLNHASLSPESPEVVQTGSFRLRSAFVWSSTLNRRTSSAYLIDDESRLVDIDLRFSPLENLELGASVPVIWRGPGIMDSFLDAFHRAFGLPRGDRDRVPDDRFDIVGNNSDGTMFDIREQGTRIGDISIRGKYLFTAGDEIWPALSGLLELRLPTGSDAYGQDEFDLTAALLSSKRWGNISIYTGVAYIYFADTRAQDLHYRSNHVEATGHFELGITEHFSVIGGVYYASALLQDVVNFPDYALYLDTGVIVASDSGLKLELLVRENPAHSKSTVDISFLVAVSYAPA